MKKKVLILSGGISKERLISLDTGNQVAKELKKNGYKIKMIESKYKSIGIDTLDDYNEAIKFLNLKLISFAGIVITFPNLFID